MQRVQSRGICSIIKRECRTCGMQDEKLGECGARRAEKRREILTQKEYHLYWLRRGVRGMANWFREKGEHFENQVCHLFNVGWEG